jgi:hypothetical protein
VPRYILSELIKVFSRDDAYLPPLAQALLQMLQHATAQLTTYEQVRAGLGCWFDNTGGYSYQWCHPLPCAYGSVNCVLHKHAVEYVIEYEHLLP